MKKPQLGDLFQVETSGKSAFLHYVGEDDVTQLARVFYHFGNEPVDFGNMVKQTELYVIFFPLAGSYRKKLIEKVGNFPVPKGFLVPKFMRSEYVVRGKFLCWHIVNIKTLKREVVYELSEEQKKISPFGIWNKAYLISRLEKNWTLDKWVYE